MSTPSEKTYDVRDMTCGHCELSVTEEVSGLPGVSFAKADHATGRLVVRGEIVEDEAVRTAVAEAGYEVTG